MVYHRETAPLKYPVIAGVMKESLPVFVLLVGVAKLVRYIVVTYLVAGLPL